MIKDYLKQRIPLNTNFIKYKTLKIDDYLKENEETATNSDFLVSKGSFHRVIKPLSLYNLKIESEIALADKEAVEIYPNDGKKV